MRQLGSDDGIWITQDGQTVSPSLLPSYSDIQTIINDWSNSITLVNGTIDIAAGSFPSNPTIRVDINDFDNMPEYISLDLIGSEPVGDEIWLSDNLTFYPVAGLLDDNLYASGAFTGAGFCRW